MSDWEYVNTVDHAYEEVILLIRRVHNFWTTLRPPSAKGLAELPDLELPLRLAWNGSSDRDIAERMRDQLYVLEHALTKASDDRWRQVVRLLTTALQFGLNVADDRSRQLLSGDELRNNVEALWREFGQVSDDITRGGVERLRAEVANSIAPLHILLSPGRASREELQRFFEALSEYNVAFGGPPLQFTLDGEEIRIGALERV